ncbi:hypothetical protein BDQ12DRAFT_723921 [Crucibulum laeve]|uniref:Uncharacterized protein n=1 Tax=Crucibulum laeve TaxID=68775 RepID=A0A5C3M0I7_9AGAR|nr:hypothetical protein BDQ12DRAFT_723921 [Crucibulum laeve]
MKFPSSFSFIFFFVLFGSSARSLSLITGCTTVAQEQSDIQALSSMVTAAHNTVVGVPNAGLTLTQALALHNSLVNLDTAVEKVISDIQAGCTLTSGEAAALAAAIEVFLALLCDIIQVLGTKKAAFQALSIGVIPGLILQDVKMLYADLITFLNLIARVWGPIIPIRFLLILIKAINSL